MLTADTRYIDKLVVSTWPYISEHGRGTGPHDTPCLPWLSPLIAPCTLHTTLTTMHQQQTIAGARVARTNLWPLYTDLDMGRSLLLKCGRL